jgi:hypothetical protein
MTDMLVLSGVRKNDFRKEEPACPTDYFTMDLGFVATSLKRRNIKKVR